MVGDGTSDKIGDVIYEYRDRVSDCVSFEKGLLWTLKIVINVLLFLPLTPLRFFDLFFYSFVSDLL